MRLDLLDQSQKEWIKAHLLEGTIFLCNYSDAKCFVASRLQFKGRIAIPPWVKPHREKHSALNQVVT